MLKKALIKIQKALVSTEAFLYQYKSILL